MNIQSLILQASQGDPEAQFKLALAYANGEGVEVDPNQFSHWAHASADQGHAKAMYALAEAYFIGHLLPKDGERSNEWLCRATDAGLPEAQLSMGKRLASQSNDDPVKLAQVRELIWKSARQEYPDAQRILGYCYHRGEVGLTKDSVIAMEWFAKAARNGDADSQFELGLGYYHGDGLPKSQVMAAWYWHKAALQAHVAATSNLGNIYRDGDGFAKNPERAADLWESAVRAGDGIAMLNLAGCYLEGIGKPKDEDEGVRLLERAVEAGRHEAFESLTRVSFYSSDERRREQAADWACMAAAIGHLRPCEFMAVAIGNREERAEKLKATSWAYAVATLYREGGSPMHADMLENFLIPTVLGITLTVEEARQSSEMAGQIIQRIKTFQSR